MRNERTPDDGPPPAGRARRWAYLALGYAAVALGAVGAFLPVLPTTPFLLVAAWAFAKASPALEQWLYEHPRFGPFLRDWRDRRAIPRRGKAAALGGMAGSWALIYHTTEGTTVPLAAGAVMLAVAVYVATRPLPEEGR